MTKIQQFLKRDEIIQIQEQGAREYSQDSSAANHEQTDRTPRKMHSDTLCICTHFDLLFLPGSLDNTAPPCILPAELPERHLKETSGGTTEPGEVQTLM